MAKYVLSCCSTADLTREHFDSLDISVIYFHYFLDDVEYSDDLYQSMSAADFYRRMTEGAETRTAQVNVEEFLEYFRRFLRQGKDILHVSLSSGISGVSNAANAARSLLEDEFPNRKIYVVDSLGASSGYGLFMDTLGRLRRDGMGIDELYAWAMEHRLNMHHWFFSTDLTFYIKGGRVSKAAGAFGKMLNICPLLNMDDRGRLIPREKVRTKKRVIRRALEMMQAHAEKGADYDGKVFICQSACRGDAEELAALVEQAFPKMDGKVLITDIGPTIGAHTGPGTVSLFFWGDKRVN